MQGAVDARQVWHSGALVARCSVRETHSHYGRGSAWFAGVVGSPMWVVGPEKQIVLTRTSRGGQRCPENARAWREVNNSLSAAWACSTPTV